MFYFAVETPLTRRACTERHSLGIVVVLVTPNNCRFCVKSAFACDQIFLFHFPPPLLPGGPTAPTRAGSYSACSPPPLLTSAPQRLLLWGWGVLPALPGPSAPLGFPPGQEGPLGTALELSPRREGSVMTTESPFSLLQPLARGLAAEPQRGTAQKCVTAVDAVQQRRNTFAF